MGTGNEFLPSQLPRDEMRAGLGRAVPLELRK
jgi:hypothetical protein